MVEYGGQTYAGMPYGVLNPGILQTRISFLPHEVIYDGTNAGGMLNTVTLKFVSHMLKLI